MARGFAFGAGLLIVGFEFEYPTAARTRPTARHHCNGYGQRYPCRRRSRFTESAVFHDRSGRVSRTAGLSDTSFGVNTGGGAKISLLGPLRHASTTGCSRSGATRSSRRSTASVGANLRLSQPVQGSALNRNHERWTVNPEHQGFVFPVGSSGGGSIASPGSDSASCRHLTRVAIQLPNLLRLLGIGVGEDLSNAVIGTNDGGSNR